MRVAFAISESDQAIDRRSRMRGNACSSALPCALIGKSVDLTDRAVTPSRRRRASPEAAFAAFWSPDLASFSAGAMSR
jgi:hypothetical protein